MNVKQVIVLRKDLNMRKGKMVAQGAHASLKVFLDMGLKNTPGTLTVPLWPAARTWIEGQFTKVCVGVDSEKELLYLRERASLSQIPSALIQDAGHTEFKGVPTYTALAIGPWDSDMLDKLTGHLKLL